MEYLPAPYAVRAPKYIPAQAGDKLANTPKGLCPFGKK